jgi:hypothetical protein
VWAILWEQRGGVRTYPQSGILGVLYHIGDENAVSALPAVIEHHTAVVAQTNNQFHTVPPFRKDFVRSSLYHIVFQKATLLVKNEREL